MKGLGRDGEESIKEGEKEGKKEKIKGVYDFY